MRKIMKKVVALAAVATMTVTSLVGCATGSNVDNTEVVATVGDSEITAGVANFYLRYQQASMESVYEMYLGENFWSNQSSEGGTYADSLKDTTIAALHEFYVLEDHMADYNVTISDEELAAIDEAAAAFVEDNSSTAIKNVSGDKEVVAEVLRLFTINEKMYQAMTKDVNREVSDEEAAQKRLRYFYVNKTSSTGEELTEDELAALKLEAEAFLNGAEANGNMEAYAKENEITTYALTFDADSTAIAEEVIEVADKLKEGEFSNVIDTENFYYVIQLESGFDEEATETEKESIIETREVEAYTEVADGWLEKTTLEINEDVWEKVNVEAIKVLVTEE